MGNKQNSTSMTQNKKPRSQKQRTKDKVTILVRRWNSFRNLDFDEKGSKYPVLYKMWWPLIDLRWAMALDFRRGSAN